jgi:hypothetical protein
MVERSEAQYRFNEVMIMYDALNTRRMTKADYLTWMREKGWAKEAGELQAFWQNEKQRHEKTAFVRERIEAGWIDD